MGGSNSWRQQMTAADWMRDMEKRILHEERRPNIRTAADLLGPGLAPYSIWINDWSAPETGFNGYFHSEPGAFSTPLNTRYWMGSSQATEDGFGLQRVTEYRGYTTDKAWPRPSYIRKFFTNPGLQRQFSTWRIDDDTAVGLLAEYAVPSTAPNGWLLCNGTLRDVVDYPDLYAVIGTRYNTGGEPGSQFRLPNISGKVIKA